MNRFAIICCLLYLSGCAAMLTQDELPVVNVSYFNAVPSRGVAPEFEIGLHIVNPADRPLNLQGIVYEIHLEGHRVLVGVSNQLPGVPAYGEADAVLRATTDMLSSIRLISDLMQQQRDSLNYRFSAKLDVGGFARRLDIVKEGEVNLSSRR